MNTDEAGTGVIAGCFAGRNFAVGLRIGHARFNLVQNLVFGKSSVFQARNLRHAQRGLPLQVALQNNLNEVV